MAWAAAVAQGAGGLMSANASIEQGKQAYVAGEYNARSADENARLARTDAAEQERRQRVTSRKIIGDARTSYGASGVTTEGSPLDVLEESAATAELDALTIKHAGDIKAIGYQNEAALQRYAAKNALKGSQTAAVTALLGAGAKLYSSSGGGTASAAN